MEQLLPLLLLLLPQLLLFMTLLLFLLLILLYLLPPSFLYLLMFLLRPANVLSNLQLSMMPRVCALSNAILLFWFDSSPAPYSFSSSFFSFFVHIFSYYICFCCRNHAWGRWILYGREISLSCFRNVDPPLLYFCIPSCNFLFFLCHVWINADACLVFFAKKQRFVVKTSISKPCLWLFTWFTLASDLWKTCLALLIARVNLGNQ